MYTKTNPPVRKPEQTQTPKPKELSSMALAVIEAVDHELVAEIVPRHKINELSPSWPWHFRTMANRDSKKTSQIETIMIGGRQFYKKSSMLDFLRRELAGR